jgi:hypothetical protein
MGPPPMLLLPSLLLPTLVKKYPCINGISCWVIHLLQLLVTSSSQINCPWFPPSYPQFVLHVSRARVIIFISISVLFLVIFCNFFSLMHGPNNRFYLSIVDDFSKYTWLYPLRLKSDVCATFLRFKQLVETYCDTKIMSVQSDNGDEFRPLQTSLTAMRVFYRLSCPHTHHQMGSVERKHRHIVETGLTLLVTSTVPFTFWDSAFDTATYLINRLPSKVTQQKSPFEYLFKISPNYKFLKKFG